MTHGNVGTTVIFPVARRHRQLTGNVLYCLLTGSEGWSYKPGVITHAAARTRDALIASPTPNTLRHHASQRNCSKKTVAAREPYIQHWNNWYTAARREMYSLQRSS